MSRRKGGLAVLGATALVVIVLVGADATRAVTHPYSGTIAFLRWPGGVPAGSSTGPSLYVVHADGSGLRRLTPQGTSVMGYRWAPDGGVIAYTDQRFSLWLVRPDGTGRRRLLSSSELGTVGLSWSPDGKELAIVSPGPVANPRSVWCTKLTLYVVRLSGGSPSHLADGRVGCDVDWSSRGDEIAYTATGPDRSGTRAIRPDGTGDRRISNVAGGGAWSADGTELSFALVLHLPSGTSDRYRAFGVVRADGTDFHVVTTHAYNEYGRAWSPHGLRLLYGRADRKGIYVIGADGRGNRRVTPDAPPQAAWGAFGWSPDGDSIVYTTGGVDDTDLDLIGIDGRGKTRLTHTPDIDISPSWVAR